MEWIKQAKPWLITCFMNTGSTIIATFCTTASMGVTIYGCPLLLGYESWVVRTKEYWKNNTAIEWPSDKLTGLEQAIRSDSWRCSYCCWWWRRWRWSLRCWWWEGGGRREGGGKSWEIFNIVHTKGCTFVKQVTTFDVCRQIILCANICIWIFLKAARN
jgi:hypothetical protein